MAGPAGQQAPGVSAPAVQHLLVRYAKRGKMRFASHRDIGRAFERGVRRAALPVAHSSGFTPHPRISYAGGAPTGVASEAEYLSLALASPQDPGLVRDRLDAALPDGIDVIDVTEHSGGTLAVRLTASEWRVTLPGVSPEAAAAAARAFLAAARAPVERLTNKGVRRVDARAAVAAMELDRHWRGTYPYESGTLRIVVRHTEPAVRPDDVLTALRQVTGVASASPARMTRLAQGALTGEDTSGGEAMAGGTVAGGESTAGSGTAAEFPERAGFAPYLERP